MKRCNAAGESELVEMTYRIVGVLRIGSGDKLSRSLSRHDRLYGCDGVARSSSQSKMQRPCEAIFFKAVQKGNQSKNLEVSKEEM